MDRPRERPDGWGRPVGLPALPAGRPGGRSYGAESRATAASFTTDPPG